ncbi:DUF2529 family protein [Gottfriedia sp. OAE603]|uniref:DUF2529 family protein n=1 Tax=Gottfriedia sp. OAE603 TaxID=2663872 RepID=UPI00178BE3D7
MLKIFTTQLNGVFQKILKQEDVFEDASRFLAQAIVGEGKVYVHGAKEFSGIVSEIKYGEDTPQSFEPLFEESRMKSLSSVDRVLLFAKQADDEEVIQIANTLTKNGIGFVVVSTVIENDSLSDLADIFINYELTRKLVPTEEGDRIGLPILLTGLFIYHCILLTINEILADFE